MITVIHGDDTLSSRKFLNSLRNNKSFDTLDAKETDFNLLSQTLRSSSLFSNEKNILIENLFALSKKENFKELSRFLNNSSSNIIIWDDKELSTRDLSNFPKAKIQFFKIPKNIFAFLDNIAPGNPKNILGFHEVLKTSDPEMVFFMLIRQFRLLLGLGSSINEVGKLAPWQKQKLQKQASKFSQEQLKNIYNKLFDIDLGVKTGEITNISQSIDILLLDL